MSNELEHTKKVKAELDAIIEASFDSIFVTDAKANVVSINEAYTRITGIKAEEIIGKNMYDLVEQGLYDRSATIQVIENHTPITFVQTLKSGKTLLVTGNPVLNDEGELAWVITNGRDITELMRLKQEVELAQNLSKHYEEELKKVVQSGEMIVNSSKTKELLDLAIRLGKVDSTVLIYGESGVGKELIARELHKNSNRKDKPLININCAAIPETLLESELFGYESGAFSGAKKGGKMGIFELASGGTLFLDEIGEMPPTLQSKLLRAIQEKEILRIGATNPIKIDVRLITATNRDLWEMTRRGQFRQDLYYRLNVVPIHVPPLRERKEEIPALTFHFLHLFNEQYGMNKKIDERMIASLLDYDWPGNVRELRNAIERAIVTNPDEIIRSIKLGSNINDGEMEFNMGNEEVGGIDLREKVNAYEKDLLQRYVQIYKSSRKVAKALNVSQTTVVRKAAQYGISLEG
jgi:PAS domain S-box-containing protein/TyrR family helix-turn-helix protein